MDPTVDQCLSLYRVVRQVVLLSSFVAFVELAQDRKLYVHTGRYEDLTSRIVIVITPEGEVIYE